MRERTVPLRRDTPLTQQAIQRVLGPQPAGARAVTLATDADRPHHFELTAATYRQILALARAGDFDGSCVALFSAPQAASFAAALRRQLPGLGRGQFPWGPFGDATKRAVLNRVIRLLSRGLPVRVFWS
jgi:hypothetical protein